MSAVAEEIPADVREVLDGKDGYSLVRAMLKFAGDRDSKWAGIPMPLEGETLVVEHKYPMPAAVVEIMKSGMRLTGGDEQEPAERPRNVFWSSRYRRDIVVWNRGDGKVEWGVHRGHNSFELMLRTLGCSFAWGIEQESKAVQLLAQHLTHVQFKQYMLTGMFVENSKRSGVTYCFRRLRPTVAIRPHPENEGTRVIATLCLHPIAYYDGSHAGAMCPTDDVIAHLLLMRGDEHLYWRRANQHPAIRPESAL